MFQNYNYFPQSPQQVSQPQMMYAQMPQYRQAPPQNGLKGRLVSSLEEARATSIDFDGSVFYFPDLANRRIYTKQINMDGTATLCMYELRDLPTEKESAVIPSIDKFVTREEFDRVVLQLQLLQKQQPSEPEAQKEKVELLSF